MSALDEEVAQLQNENCQRVLRGEGSPKILVGGITIRFPNFAIYPLLRMGASLVGLSEVKEHEGIPDRLFIDPRENLNVTLERLPPAWRPDFFWDPQVEHGHYLPIGLSEAPFPSVCSFNHAHLGQALHHMERMFDTFIAPSRWMHERGWGDTWLPWGASWGTFGERISIFQASYQGGEKPVDVICPLGAKLAKESKRFPVLDALRNLQKKRKDWTIEIPSGLSQPDYFKALAKAKVVVNVGTWGSPVSYRPLEAIEQEAILVHVEETAYGSGGEIGDVFPEDWYVKATPETLEEAIQIALQRTGQAKAIKAALEEKYSYRAQYARLFEVAGKTRKKKRLSLRDWSRRAFAVNHLTGFHALSNFHAWSLTPEDRNTAFECPEGPRDVNLWQPEDPEERYRWQTELSLRNEMPNVISRRYADSRGPLVASP